MNDIFDTKEGNSESEKGIVSPCIRKAKSAYTRERRLLTAKDFSTVFRKAKRYRCEAFTVLVRSNNCGTSRVGFAIAKKKIKKATARNHLKRLVRESFRLNNQLAMCCVDIVVLGNKNADNFLNQQIYEQLQKLWKQIIQAHTKVPKGS